VKTIVQYNRHELDAIVKLVVENNPHAAKYGEEYVRSSVLRSIEAFKDTDVRYTGTMGYLVTAIEEEEIDADTRTRMVYVEFSLSAHLRAKDFEFNYITL